MAWTFGPLLLQGLTHTVEPSVITTQVESGPARKKRFSSDDINRIDGSVYLPTAAALQAWWTFWDVESNHGASWHDMPLSTMGVTVNHTSRLSQPRVSRLGRGWSLTLQIETRERLIV